MDDRCFQVACAAPFWARGWRARTCAHPSATLACGTAPAAITHRQTAQCTTYQESIQTFSTLKRAPALGRAHHGGLLREESNVGDLQRKLVVLDNVRRKALHHRVCPRNQGNNMCGESKRVRREKRGEAHSHHGATAMQPDRFVTQSG
jgi:hypothetical protein